MKTKLEDLSYTKLLIGLLPNCETIYAFQFLPSNPTS